MIFISLLWVIFVDAVDPGSLYGHSPQVFTDETACQITNEAIKNAYPNGIPIRLRSGDIAEADYYLECRGIAPPGKLSNLRIHDRINN